MQLCVRRCASRCARTQSAVSGSSEAVGSSSSSSCGSLISALASATRVFCPAERRPLGRSRKSPSARSFGELRRSLRRDRRRRRAGRRREILPHGEAMRHVDIGTLEIHAAERGVAIARHVAAEDVDRTGRRFDEAHDHADRRGLAGAIAAEQAGDGAGAQARNRAGRPLCDRRKLLERPATASVGLGATAVWDMGVIKLAAGRLARASLLTARDNKRSSGRIERRA